MTRDRGVAVLETEFFVGNKDYCFETAVSEVKTNGFLFSRRFRARAKKTALILSVNFRVNVKESAGAIDVKASADYRVAKRFLRAYVFRGGRRDLSESNLATRRVRPPVALVAKNRR